MSDERASGTNCELEFVQEEGGTYQKCKTHGSYIGRECVGYVAALEQRAEQAGRDLAECRERIGHLTSANIECGRKVEQAERRLADVQAERDRSVKYGMALDQSIDVLVEELAKKERQHADQLAALKVTWEAKDRALAEAHIQLTRVILHAKVSPDELRHPAR